MNPQQPKFKIGELVDSDCFGRSKVTEFYINASGTRFVYEVLPVETPTLTFLVFEEEISHI